VNGTLLSVLGGGAVGLGAGFVVSILSLQLRRLRNARLVDRGGMPLKDAIRPPFTSPCAAAGAVLGGGLSMVVPLSTAIPTGGGTLPAALLLLSIGVTVAQLRDRASPPGPPPPPDA